MSRIVITGGPRTGKTTHVNGRGYLGKVRHSDDLIHMEWSAASEAAALWLNEPGPWVCEGVAMVRSLRKWMQANPGKPADTVIWFGTPKVPLSSGQAAMAKGCETVWREVEPQLRQRGVEIRYQ